MPRQKLNRYARISADSRVVKGYENLHELFSEERKKYKKVILEVACGRGEYSVGLAQKFPDTLFIGIDSKGDRIGVGLDRSHQVGVENIRFVCGIVHHVQNRFPSESVDEIWIVHPDPRPKGRDEKRRLTHPKFLQMYHSILKPGGIIRLKTDDVDLFQYSVVQFGDFIIDGQLIWENMSASTDLYADQKLLGDHYGIQTHYEKLALAEDKKICYGVWKKRVLL